MSEMESAIKIAVRKFNAFETFIAKTWNSYCEHTGCELVLEAAPLDLHPLHKTLLQEEGLRKGLWDIALINTDWIAEAYKSNALEDLTPYIAEAPPEGFPSGWSTSLLDMQVFEGKTMALPFHNGPECLIYRKDLFESEKEKSAYKAQFGTHLKVPDTWDELVQVATFFNRPDENLYGTTFAAYPDGHNTVFDFCLQLWTRGGDLFDAEGNIRVDTPIALEGMKFYRNVLQNHNVVHPNSREFDSVKSGMAFANGQLAMMVNWFGFASMCEVIPESKVKQKVDVAKIPAGPNGKGVSLNAYWMYTIGSGSHNKQIAYDFIAYAINQRNDKKLTLEGGIGCRKTTWYDAEVNQIVPYYHKLEALHENTRALPLKGNWAQMAHVIDQMVLDITNTKKEISMLLSKAQKLIDTIENRQQ